MEQERQLWLSFHERSNGTTTIFKTIDSDNTYRCIDMFLFDIHVTGPKHNLQCNNILDHNSIFIGSSGFIVEDRQQVIIDSSAIDNRNNTFVLDSELKRHKHKIFIMDLSWNSDCINNSNGFIEQICKGT